MLSINLSVAARSCNAYGSSQWDTNHPVSGKNIGLDPDGSYVPGECEQITQSSDKMASPWRFEHVLPPYLVQNEN